MHNPLFWRMMLVSVILITTTAGFLAYSFMKSPDNLVVIFFSAAMMGGSAFFVLRKEKSARFESYYSTALEFGSPLSFGNFKAAFERNGTRFDVKFPKGKHNQFFNVSFYVPDVREKFSIQNRTLATRYDSDCRVVQESPLPQEYILQSRNPEFLLNLLKKREIHSEVINYPASLWGRILISLEDGSFEIIWAPPVSGQIDGLNQVCRTAVVFHDELKKARQGNFK